MADTNSIIITSQPLILYDRLYPLVQSKRFHGHDFYSNPNLGVDDSSDLPFRLHEILQKCLNAQIHINDYTCTVRDVLISPETKKRLFKEIVELVRELYRAMIEYAYKRHEAFINHPQFLAAVKFREDYINLKVINLIFKFANALFKLISEPASKAIKHSGSFFKIAKKVLNVRDLDFRKINFKNLLNEDVLHEMFKAVFYALKIPANIIDFANNNPYLLMAYESAGLGETYKPFTGVFVDWCEAISPWVTCFKIVSQAWALKNAVQEYRQIKPNDPQEECNKKLLILVKAVVTIGTEALKITIKLSLVSSTGLLSVVIIPVGSCSIALLGLWLVYKGVHREAPAPKDLDADQRADATGLLSANANPAAVPA